MAGTEYALAPFAAHRLKDACRRSAGKPLAGSRMKPVLRVLTHRSQGLQGGLLRGAEISNSDQFRTT